MASREIRTRQMILEEFYKKGKKSGEKGLKSKPTRENLIGKVETKEESVELFKNLLREKPGDNVEIKAYWPSRRGKFDDVILKHDSKKTVKGEEVIIEAPSTIKQIAMLSAKKGMPESISVKIVDRLYAEDFLPGELIIDTKVELVKIRKQIITKKESSIIRSYHFADPDYRNVFLNMAREWIPDMLICRW